jgi:hypothetical protein
MRQDKEEPMTKQDLIHQLSQQLAALTVPPVGYEVLNFQIWDAEQAQQLCGDAVVRVEPRAWTWGHCQSETCAHNSHDPLIRGDRVWITCQEIGMDAEGYPQYCTPQGVVFHEIYRTHGHFAPTAGLYA